MRVLIAPDGFGDTLTAQQAADAISEGWAQAAPGDALVRCPMADGGPGFLDALRAHLGGELHSVTVSSPLGEPVPAALLVVDGPDGARTAYVESAHAIGLQVVPPERRDPTRTSSAGIGMLLRAAVDSGARRVVVGLGGSATNDAGAGMLAELGVGEPGSVLAGGGGGLGGVGPADLAGLAAVRAGLRGVEILVACDVDVPLLGLHGASAGFAAQKGASAEQAQDLERALGHFAHLAVAALGDAVRPDLLARSAAPAPRLASAPGAGAAGGLGFGLSLLGARLAPGSALVADAVGLARQVGEADVVVTGEGRFDWQSLHGKVVAAVAERALAAAVPAVVIAGQVDVGRREWGAAGIAGVYAVAQSPAQVAESLKDPAGALRRRAARVAQTWSR
ncbi:glycerate kinase family protein [Cellulomonas chengniuliangii]|uniref:glycerate kinase family protein n=1 Tax=Cellulomonas chengniuliangii TaxID=2968084 RepID=UPI001D0EC980|nr:glycerate kinase [Cellulomonas chengniuliangii]MCC2317652.1 glycerate kinase [Cellulomonas chengniuliangii]